MGCEAKEDMKQIGQFVRRHIPAIFRYCEAHDPRELVRLQDARYCKDIFDINYPFCAASDTIVDTGHRRYWSATHTVNGVQVRVTNHWFNPPTSASYPKFKRYLRDRDITITDAPAHS